ncbi:hypothetical protein KIPB_016113, partial [Kipferlia bialata]
INGVWEAFFIADSLTGLLSLGVCVYYLRRMGRSALEDQKGEEEEGEGDSVDAVERGQEPDTHSHSHSMSVSDAEDSRDV